MSKKGPTPAEIGMLKKRFNLAFAVGVEKGKIVNTKCFDPINSDLNEVFSLLNEDQKDVELFKTFIEHKKTFQNTDSVKKSDKQKKQNAFKQLWLYATFLTKNGWGIIIKQASVNFIPPGLYRKSLGLCKLLKGEIKENASDLPQLLGDVSLNEPEPPVGAPITPYAELKQEDQQKNNEIALEIEKAIARLQPKCK